MSRTTRKNRPSVVAYYRGSYYGKGWMEERSWSRRVRDLYSREELPDGKASRCPGGKRFKSTYRRIERHRAAQAVREEDFLEATAPEKRCLWKDARY